MDVAHPYKAVCPALDGDVLMALAASEMGMTGRQVAALTGRSSHSGVLSVLNRLTEQGLVDRVELNRAFLFSLNRAHLAYPAVVALKGLRIAFIEGVQEEIKTWKVPPVHGSLFGSFARGDGDTHSDIDLFLVRPTSVPEEDDIWREQLDELALTISRRTGNRASIHEVSEAELPRLRTDPPPIVAQLRSDAIRLSGPPVSTLLGSE